MARRMYSTGRKVYVASAGRVSVTRNKGRQLDEMGAEAVKSSIKDGNISTQSITGLYVGNMMSGILSHQQHLGPLIAGAAGLVGVDAATAEACCGAGGAALRWGCMAVASGYHDTVVVVGTEAMTHTDTSITTKGLATASHWASEGGKGETFVSLNGALMKLYMDKYRLPHTAFAPFPITAHEHAILSPEAVFHKKITEEVHRDAPSLWGPVQLFDACPTCDGAAAVVLTSDPKIAEQKDGSKIVIAGSASACDYLPVHQRPEPLRLQAVEQCTDQVQRKFQAPMP